MRTDDFESIKHSCDAIFSVAAIGSFFSWMSGELPDITMWVTFISALLSGMWWVYRWAHHIIVAIRVHNARQK